MIQLPETKPWFWWRSWECHVSRGCTVVSSKSIFFEPVTYPMRSHVK